MGQLGSGGKHANNCWRDLLAMLPDIHIPKVVTIPTPGKKNSKLVIPMIFPHEMFSCLFHDYPSAWERYICPSLDLTMGFWKAVSKTNLWKQHPLRFVTENRRTFCILDRIFIVRVCNESSIALFLSCESYGRYFHFHGTLQVAMFSFQHMGFLLFFCTGIPLALHGDAVPCVNVGSAHSRSVEAISWRSLLCQAVFWPLGRKQLPEFREFRELYGEFRMIGVQGW